MRQLNVDLMMYGRAKNAPVSVEILDQDLTVVAQHWLDGHGPQTFSLPDGIYAVRAALPSGRSFQKTVALAESDTTAAMVTIPVHEASPHESHEWAYVSRDIAAVGSGLLSEDRFKGLWARLWTRRIGDDWQVQPLETPSDLSDEEDGVSFGVHTNSDEQTMLQVGGDSVPWKLAVLPPAKETMILIRPTTGPAGRVHPIDLTVASTDWELESLLSLLTRGKTEQAADLLGQRDLADAAEQRLYSKMQDPYGALIGGYALLHLQALDKMHNWANNLANWFEWIPDGPVIHGWKQFELARDQTDDAKREQLIADARRSFLEAERRGVPVISEGLRRLRDGLLMFRSQDRTDAQVKEALSRIGEFTAAADFTSSTTVYTGTAPTQPTVEPPVGCPTDEEFYSYVYDVPLSEAIESGELVAGTELQSNASTEVIRGRVTDGGQIEMGGQVFDSFGALQQALRGEKREELYNLRVQGASKSVNDVARSLRFRPRKAYPRTD